jgi:hypothetical protein
MEYVDWWFAPSKAFLKIGNYKSVGLCSMVIRLLKQVFLSIFFPEMYMAIRLMVIDTQNLVTFRIRTNPALWRCP